MTINEAIAAVEAAGYRVTKPRERRAVAPKLNAVGKPFGANYDPNYRMKYRTPRVAYRASTAANLRGARHAYLACMAAKHGSNPELLAAITKRQGVN